MNILFKRLAFQNVCKYMVGVCISTLYTDIKLYFRFHSHLNDVFINVMYGLIAQHFKLLRNKCFASLSLLPARKEGNLIYVMFLIQ